MGLTFLAPIAGAPIDLGPITKAIADAKTTADQAAAAAAEAAAKGDNARQMVLNRDAAAAQTATTAANAAATATDLAGKVTTLQQVADSVTALNGASVADRQALHTQLDALVARVNALPAGIKVTAGTATTATLLAVGASADLSVTLRTPMPSNAYDVAILPTSSGVLLGNATAVVKAQTRTTVTITVKAVVAVAAGSTYTVLVWG